MDDSSTTIGIIKSAVYINIMYTRSSYLSESYKDENDHADGNDTAKNEWVSSLPQVDLLNKTVD